MDSDEFDDDPAYDVNNDYYDNLTVPVSSILTTIISEEPNSPQHFIFDFISLYPQYNELFWWRSVTTASRLSTPPLR